MPLDKARAETELSLPRRQAEAYGAEPMRERGEEQNNVNVKVFERLSGLCERGHVQMPACTEIKRR